jgi:hypothetical protein
LDLRELRADINFETVKIFARSGRLLDIVLLDPKSTFRPGQAKERFEVAVANMLGLSLVILILNLLSCV